MTRQEFGTAERVVLMVTCIDDKAFVHKLLRYLGPREVRAPPAVFHPTGQANGLGPEPRTVSTAMSYARVSVNTVYFS